MKATELRIGNLIGCDIQTLIVKAVNDETVICHTMAGKPYVLHLEDVYDLKLTEEWLVKFGLKPNQWFYENSFCIVEDITGDTHYGWCMKVQNASHTKEIEFGYFQYVHQLQNLYFALTGEELIIKAENNETTTN